MVFVFELVSELSRNWLLTAVAVCVPSDTISRFVRSLHQVNSELTFDLCDMWLRLARTRLRKSRVCLTDGIGSAVLSNLPMYQMLPLSASEYPRKLLQSALITIEELKIDLPRALVESAAIAVQHPDDATRRLVQIKLSSEPRERVLSLLEAFVFDELAKALGACYSSSNIVKSAELLSPLVVAAPATVAARHSDVTASMEHHLYTSVESRVEFDSNSLAIATDLAADAFRAGNVVFISSTTAHTTESAKREYLRSISRRQFNRVYMAALESLSRELAAAGQFNRVADIFLKISNSVDITAMQQQIDSSSTASAVSSFRYLISSVLLPNDLLAIIFSNFMDACALILSKPNGGACMDAHLLVPREAFSLSNSSLAAGDTALPASNKALLALKYARIIFQQTKLASLHAYCIDYSHQDAASTFRDSPAVHTELAKMDAAVDQVERWLRNPSAFNACLPATGSNVVLGDRVTRSGSVQNLAFESFPLSDDNSDMHVSMSSAVLASSVSPSPAIAATSAVAADQLDVLSMVSLKVRFC